MNHAQQVRNARLVLGFLALALSLVAGMTLIVTAPAHATDTRRGCASVHVTSKSDRADQCRARGWFVGPNYTITPQHVLRYYNLRSCRFEDGSGQPNQRSACGWNVTGHDGNGCGSAYVVITDPVNGGRAYVYLMRWNHDRLVPFHRSCS